METKTKTQKVSKVKLNVNFIDFVGTVIEQKLLTKDKKELKDMYVKAVKLKSANNVHRVADRTKRTKLRSALEKALKAKGITFADFDKASTGLVNKIRTRKASEYIEV